MKKFMSLVLCLALGSFALAGCSDNSEPFQEKTYTPDVPVSGIDLDVRDREIQVSPSEDGQIHIRYSENSKEYYEISVSEEHVLTMAGASNKEWTDYLGGKPAAEDRKIYLEIPSGALSSLALSTTNENISLSPLAVTGDVSLSANGGSLSFEALDAGSSLDLYAKNGDISGTVTGSYDDFTIAAEVKKAAAICRKGKTAGKDPLRYPPTTGMSPLHFPTAEPPRDRPGAKLSPLKTVWGGKSDPLSKSAPGPGMDRERFSALGRFPKKADAVPARPVIEAASPAPRR